jgi:hypothetical protein
MVNTMHILAVNSVAKLLSVLQDQIQHTPTHAVIHSWADTDAAGDGGGATEDSDRKVQQDRFRPLVWDPQPFYGFDLFQN